jgi:hypothetical protein
MQPTVITCRVTHVERYTPRVHMLGSMVMSSKIKAPNARMLHELCLTLLLQASKGSISPPKPCTPMGPLPMHEHYCNLGVPDLTLGLHASNQATLCCLGLDALLQDAKHSSS